MFTLSFIESEVIWQMFSLQATYKSRPDAYICSLEDRFSSAECLTLEGFKQKCVLAVCKDSTDKTTLYIAFTGSVYLDDWLVNLNVEMDQSGEDFNPDVRFHQGFYTRAKLWVEKFGEFKNVPGTIGKIITTGHSLGAATSAMVHLLLSKKLDKHDIELHNVTFALPLFGNMALNDYIYDAAEAELKDKDKSKSKKRAEDKAKIKTKTKGFSLEAINMRNMHHFVSDVDIVPAAMFIPHAYSSLSLSLQKLVVDKAEFLLGLFKYIGFVKLESKEDEEKMDKVIKVLSTQIAAQKTKGSLNCLFQNESYVPIGNYLIMKNSELHELKNDPQWTGQILVESLKILGRLCSKWIPIDIVQQYTPINGIYLGENRDVAHEILQNHAITTYGDQIAECLTNGVHNSFMQWKMETDLKVRFNLMRRAFD